MVIDVSMSVLADGKGGCRQGCDGCSCIVFQLFIVVDTNIFIDSTNLLNVIINSSLPGSAAASLCSVMLTC